MSAMKTLSLTELSLVLKKNREVCRRMAKRGDVPGIKVGKNWIFLESKIEEWLGGERWSTDESTKTKPEKNMKERFGGQALHRQVESKYEDLLGLPKKPKHNS